MPADILRQKAALMTPQRIFGLVLLIVGAMLFFFGLNASHSIADQVSNVFTGRFTDRTTWYILGGIVAAISGAAMLFVGSRNARS